MTLYSRQTGAPPLLCCLVVVEVQAAQADMLSLLAALSASAAILVAVLLTAKPAVDKPLGPEFHN